MTATGTTGGRRVLTGRRSERDLLDEMLAGTDRVTGFKRMKAQLERDGYLHQVDGGRVCGSCLRLVAKHSDPCRVCGRPPEHHVPGEEDDEWEGLARMAKARLAAHQPVKIVDHEALDRCPEPRTGLLGRVA